METPSSDSSTQVQPQVEQVSQPEPTQEPQNPIASKNPVTKRVREVARKALEAEAAKTATPNPAQESIIAPPVEKQAVEQPETPAFQPNFKVKVLDKEFEIPDSFRGLMKDETSSKEVRELFEKAHGLEPIKAQRDEFRTKAKEFADGYQGVMGQIQEAREMYARGDLDSFFQKLQVPQEKILQWVWDKVQYNQLGPEQRQLIDSQKSAERRALDLEKQNQELSRGYETQVQQAMRISLDSALARADIQPVIQNFDSRPGKQSGDPSFRDLVINHGELTWLRTQGKVTLSPEQAVQEVIRAYGLSGTQAPQPAQTPPQQVVPPANSQQAPAAPKAPPRTPVIPNVAGRAASAMPKKPKSLAEIKALYHAMKD